MSTDKDLIASTLFRYVAQRAPYLARITKLPTPSVRRILAELVAEGRAVYVKRDLIACPGYLALRRRPVQRG